MPRLQAPVAVQVLLCRGEEVLFIKRAAGVFFAHYWSLPGGHLEEGESLKEAARRELQEELGVWCAPDALVPVALIHRRSDTHRIELLFRADTWKGYPTICEPYHIEAITWSLRTTPPRPLVPYLEEIWPKIEASWYFEVGWNILGS